MRSRANKSSSATFHPMRTLLLTLSVCIVTPLVLHEMNNGFERRDQCAAHEVRKLATILQAENGNRFQFAQSTRLHGPSTKPWRALALQTPLASRAQVMRSYGKLPLSFEANIGQTDSHVQFLSRGDGYSVFLEENEAAIALRPAAPGFTPGMPPVRGGATEACRLFALLCRELNDIGHSREKIALIPASGTLGGNPFFLDEGFFGLGYLGEPAQQPETTALRLKLLGANVEAKATGLDELPGKSNYFIGNYPAMWRTNISTYAKVRYADVYPGTDLIYYGNQRQLEYDFVVNPGADPKKIKFAIDGAYEIRIDSVGDLVVDTSGGEVRFHKPIVYQALSAIESSQSKVTTDNERRIRDEINRQSSIENRQILDGRYALIANNQVVFEIPAYDSSQPLIIDPTVTYAAFLGGGIALAGIGGSSEIAVDSQGNAFVTGATVDPNFPVTPGAYQESLPAPSGSAFVTKVNPSGTALIYSTYVGGSVSDLGLAIALDGPGNAYITGVTSSADFPITTVVNQPCLSNPKTPFNVFVTELNPTGSGLLYSTCLGGNGIDGEEGRGIAVDKASGKVYVTGDTFSTDFPIRNAYQNTNHGLNSASNAFVTELDPTQSGNASLIYSTYFGGNACIPGMCNLLGS